MRIVHDLANQKRTVEVHCHTSGGYGSGYRITNRLVLTAFHILEGLQSSSQTKKHCRVRPIGEKTWHLAQLAWYNKKLDVAALSLPNPPSDIIKPALWGLAPPDRRVSCEARGFPRALNYDHGHRTTDYGFRGLIDPQTGTKRGLLCIKVASGEGRPRTINGWSGYSGAAVVCEGAITGVIVQTPEQADGLLWAQPAADFIENEEFRQLFKKDTSREPIVVPVGGGMSQSGGGYDDLYRRSLLKEVSILHLFGVDLDATTPTELPLSIAYIPLNLELSDKRSPLKPLHLNYSEILAGLPLFGQRLLIEGVAGSGKTTLLQWTVLTALTGQTAGHLAVPTMEDVQKKIETWKSELPSDAPLPSLTMHLAQALDDRREPSPQAGTLSWWERTPFLVRLRHCPGGTLPSPEKLPTLMAHEAGTPDENWVTSTIRSGRALILLDGVDEVPDQNRDDIIKSIRQYMHLYNGCQFVVTSRPAAVRKSSWANLFASSRVAIRPMAPVDIQRFIEHWYQALRHERRAEDIDRTNEQNARNIQDQIANSSALSQLAETPLLCSAICYLHRVRRGELPRRLTSLYGKLCELLVHRLDLERLKSDGLSRFSPPFYQLELEDKLQVLARLAHFMVREELSSLDVVRATEQIKGELLRLRKPEQLTPHDVLIALQERSGVLRGTSEKEVEFAHNALRSYLAAMIFAKEGSVKEIIEKAEAIDDPDLPVLAGAQGSDQYRAQLIDALTDQTDRAGGMNQGKRVVTRADRITAVRVAATGSVPDEVVSRVNALESKLLPAETQEEARHFAELGDRIIVYLKHVPSMPAESAAACVRTLRFIGGPLGRKTLEEYRSIYGAAKPDNDVLVELAQAMNPLRLATVLGLLRDSIPYGVIPEARRSLVRHVGDRDLDTFDDARSINSLNLTDTSVSDLSALQKYQGLTFLRVSTSMLAASAISGLKSVRVLFLLLDDSRPRPDQLSQGGDILPPNLESLLLDSSSVGDYGFLLQAPGIKELSLSDTDIKDLNHCGRFADIECLYIDDTEIDDLSPLENCNKLRMLVADNTNVRDLSPLRGMKSMTILSLQRTNVAECSPLGGLNNLRMLVLRGTEVSDLRELWPCRNLEVVDVSETKVSDLQPIINLPKLKRLLLTDTLVSDLRPLGSLACLEELWLDDTQVYDLQPLVHIATLRELRISRVGLRDSSTVEALRRRGVAVRGI